MPIVWPILAAWFSNMPANWIITILGICFNILTFIFRQYKPADVEALVLRKEEAVKKEQQQPQQQQQQSKKRRVISKQQQQQQQRKLSNPRWWIRE